MADEIHVAAPFSGTVIAIARGPAEEVAAGEALLVLEAMKMENHINAERGGKVAEVRVGAGDTVGTGDVLVVIQ